MQIEVWSDFACPWCALGLARLAVARASFEHGEEVAVVHRSFELDPRAPSTRPISYEESVAAKYGMGAARLRALQEQLTALGAEVGVTFDFERVKLGNTFDAHRLAQAARGTPGEEALVRGLFAARFGQGRQLSDHDVLRDVARAAGLDEGMTNELLAGDAFGTRRASRRSRGPRAGRDGRALLPHQRGMAAAGRSGRRDDGNRPAPGLVTPRQVRLRISSTISTVVLGCKNAKRATVSPSQLVGVTKAT